MDDKNIDYFEIVLIDINSTIKNKNNKIICVKKNLYDLNIKYFAVSYRWGELCEQLVQTPDYIAHVTSFLLQDLFVLCSYIKKTFNIPYLWIDGISINQSDFENKKQTIYKMDKIYSIAEKVICVPDLHKEYLLMNIANVEYYIFLKSNISIFKKILNDIQLQKMLTYYIEGNDNILSKIKLYIKLKKLNINKINYILNWIIYIINDWRNRTWVVSERIIGMKNKLIVYSLLLNCNINLDTIPDLNNVPFFTNCLFTEYFILDMVKKEETIFTMILNSNASKHEDRFFAILPHTKYSYYIGDVNSWKISDMTDVILKLLEIIDLDDKITYLLNYPIFFSDNFLPSFATTSRGLKIGNKVYEYIKIYVNDIVVNNKCLHIKSFYYKIIIEDKLDLCNNFPFEQLQLSSIDEIIIVEIPLTLAKKRDKFLSNILSLYSIIIKGNISKNKWIITEIKYEFDKKEYINIKENKEIKTFIIY